MFDFIQLKIFAMKNQYTDSLIEVSEFELKERLELDRFSCCLDQTEYTDINTLLCNNTITDTEDIVHNIEIALKGGAEIAEENKKNCLQLKFLQLKNTEKTTKLREMKSFSDKEVNEYMSCLLMILKAKMDEDNSVLSFLSTILDKRWIDECIDYWGFLSNPYSLIDLSRLWNNEPDLLKFVTMDTRGSIQSEIAEYFSEYSDDNISTLVTRFIVNSLMQKVKDTKSMDSLISFVNDKVNMYQSNGIQVNDVQLIQYALGQCKEMIENGM